MQRRVLSTLFVLTLFLACNPRPKVDLLEEGIPLKMAEYRKEQVSDVVYSLSFDIPSDRQEQIPSTL